MKYFTNREEHEFALRFINPKYVTGYLDGIETILSKIHNFTAKGDTISFEGKIFYIELIGEIQNENIKKYTLSVSFRLNVLPEYSHNLILNEMKGIQMHSEIITKMLIPMATLLKQPQIAQKIKCNNHNFTISNVSPLFIAIIIYNLYWLSDSYARLALCFHCIPTNISDPENFKSTLKIYNECYKKLYENNAKLPKLEDLKTLNTNTKPSQPTQTEKTTKTEKTIVQTPSQTKEDDVKPMEVDEVSTGKRNISESSYDNGRPTKKRIINRIMKTEIDTFIKNTPEIKDMCPVFQQRYAKHQIRLSRRPRKRILKVIPDELELNELNVEYRSEDPTPTPVISTIIANAINKTKNIYTKKPQYPSYPSDDDNKPHSFASKSEANSWVF